MLELLSSFSWGDMTRMTRRSDRPALGAPVPNFPAAGYELSVTYRLAEMYVAGHHRSRTRRADKTNALNPAEIFRSKRRHSRAIRS